MNNPAASSIIYREYSFEEDFPFLMMHSSVAPPRPNFVHFHNSIEIAYLEKGTMLWNLENENCQISEGEACILPPYFTHSSHFHPSCPPENKLCHYIYFNPERLLAPLFPNGLPEEFTWYQYAQFQKHLTADQFPEIINTIQNIVEIYKQKTDNSRNAIIGLVEYLLVLLYRNYKNQTLFTPKVRSTHLLRPALSYLNNEYSSDVSLPFLAKLCGLTEAQFSDKLKENFNQTPRQYINTIRVYKACQLLSSTEEKVLSIALMTGFKSLASFNRTFLKIMGQSPTAFRNEHRVITKRNLKHLPYNDEKKSR